MKKDKNGRRVDGRPLGYGEYINVEALLTSLRVPRDVPQGAVVADWPEWPKDWQPGDPWPRGTGWYHDEVLFITVHQAFEIWFRQIVHELDDLFARARDVAHLHDAEVPLVNLEARTDPPDLASRRSRYPQLWALAEKTPETHPVRHVPAPGEHRVDAPRASLKWFDDEWTVWIDRVARAALILKTALPFYDILAQMSPTSFLDFRNRLFPASGFGSYQFRYLELALGLRERHFDKVDWTAPDTRKARDALTGAGWNLGAYTERPKRREEAFASTYEAAQHQKIMDRFTAPSLRDLVYWLLNATELQGSNGRKLQQHADELATRIFESMFRVEHAEKAVQRPHLTDESVRNDAWRAMGEILAHAEVISASRLHRKEGSRAHAFFEACLTLDAALLAWREAHLRFVERMIGSRPGTGGGGLRYLSRTLGGGRTFVLDRAFPCLWHSRSVLM